MPLGKMPWIVNAVSFVPRPGTCEITVGVIPGVHIYVIPKLRRPQLEGKKNLRSPVYMPAPGKLLPTLKKKKKRHIVVNIITYY